MSKLRPCIFGEVLFDNFPDGSRVLGGAAFNVAWHLQAFGQQPRLISRVGSDPAGRQIRVAMHNWGMDASGLQNDTQLPTGSVAVHIEHGEPSYDIIHPSAYDAIAASGPPPCGLLYHGSLALRDPRSRQSLQSLRGQSPCVFMDANLRPPWWEATRIAEMLHGADWVKLNQAELELLYPGQLPGPVCGHRFLEAYGLTGLIVTQGARGAELFGRDGQQLRVDPVRRGEVMDTVGAGDAFAAVMLLGILNSWPLEQRLQRAQDFASHLIEHRGAVVEDPGFYAQFCSDWGLDHHCNG